MPRHPKVCILSAAEPSGDRIAAGILTKLRRHRPQLRWRGCAGDAMTAVPGAGFEPLAAVSDLSASGLVEVLPRLPAVLRARRKLQATLRDGAALAVFVDAPDFHLPLAALAREQGIKVVLVVAPQWWAWRPGRLQQISRCADLVLCLFRFEVAPLRAAGVAAHFIGHPAAPLLQQQVAPRAPQQRGALRIAVLPGSRPSEVARYLRPFVAGLQQATATGGLEAELIVPWRLPASPPPLPGVRFVREEGRAVLADADLALVAAGTATLEAAALGVPTVIAAAAHPITAAVARRLLRTDRLGLPNILLDGDVIRELHQDLRPARIAEAVAPILADPVAAHERAAGIRQRLVPVLGPPGFAARAAGEISQLLDRHV
jgi:lipid-A-disaccharide synthase